MPSSSCISAEAAKESNSGWEAAFDRMSCSSCRVWVIRLAVVLTAVVMFSTWFSACHYTQLFP
ncbi:hypothetical protein D5047_17490 [Verminephrobacter eiseniae]|nr:hypothetical protein [Verminephrobacter eiseniae]